MDIDRLPRAYIDRWTYNSMLGKIGGRDENRLFCIVMDRLLSPYLIKDTVGTRTGCYIGADRLVTG